MKFLYSIVTALVFCIAMFLKANRLAHIVNQNSDGSSSYGETYTNNYGSYSSGYRSKAPVSSGVQSNPFME